MDSLRPVYIRWRDTSSHPGWYDRAEYLEAARAPVMLMHTVGWLILENDECIVIAQSISEDKAGELLKIPREAIRHQEAIQELINGSDI